MVPEKANMVPEKANLGQTRIAALNRRAVYDFADLYTLSVGWVCGGVGKAYFCSFIFAFGVFN